MSVLSADHLAKLPQWREAAELARLAEFVVVTRPGQSAEPPAPPWRVRLLHDSGNGTAATISPRLGLELLGDGHGEGNPGYDFGDQIDNPETDRQYGITALDGDLLSGAAVFSGAVTARWGLRQSDREAVEVDGSVRASAFRMSGRRGARSKPFTGRPRLRHTSMVVPLPQNGSTTRSVSRV